MTMGEAGIHRSTGKTALRGIKRHFDEVITVAIVQLAVRAAAFSPLLLPGMSGGKMPAWICWIAVAALYIAVVIPLRFWAREKMRRIFYTRNAPSRKRNPYKKWLLTGLARYGRGILWGLPFLAGLGYFLYGKSGMSYTDMWQPVQGLARLVGQEPNIGTGGAIAGGLMLVFGLLFAYGWWRDLAVEYMPVRSIGTQKSFHWSRRLRKKHGKELRGNTAVNFLLSLPAVIGAGAVLVPYVMSKVDFSLSMDLIFNLLLRLLRTPLPKMQQVELIGVLVLLYLPLWIFRKTRNAALMGRLMRENAGHHHHEENVEASPEKEHTAHEIG